MAAMVSALAIDLAGSGPGSAQAIADFALPQISIATPAPGSILISASVVGFGPAKVTVTLLVERTGPSGGASTSQSRDIQLEAGRSEAIAELTLSFVPGDQLFVSATIAHDGTIISTATLETGNESRPISDHRGDRP